MSKWQAHIIHVHVCVHIATSILIIIIIIYSYFIVLSRRKKGDRIAVWTKEKKNKLANLHIWYVN